MISQIEQRFAQQDSKNLSMFEDVLLKEVIWDDDLLNLLALHETDVSTLKLEIQMLCREEIPEQTRQMVPEIWKRLKLLLVIPASSATAE